MAFGMLVLIAADIFQPVAKPLLRCQPSQVCFWCWRQLLIEKKIYRGEELAINYGILHVYSFEFV